VRVLVAGGTGRLGGLVVRQLVERGREVRVMTRDRGRAEGLRELGVEIVDGDVRRAETLPAALAAVDVVVSAVHGFAGPGHVSPRSVDLEGNLNLIAAAEREQTAVVLLSIVGTAADSQMELFRCKHAAEQRLKSSSVPWTIVRSVAFVELWADLVGKGVVFGRGDNPISFVSVHDVAAIVTGAVVDPGLRGQVIDVVGPRCLTLNELASQLQGPGPRRVRHVPRWLLRALAPAHRQPAAALAMDTIDMTATAVAGARVGVTPLDRAVPGTGALP
jgi:uncharacterized protein YbjT (DUF2867 family)